MDYLQTLNPEQAEVVYSKDRRLLCLAGAGTGKTHTLISRIAYLVDECDVKPDEVLALTFTNAAAREMESRYLLYANNPSTPWFGTFHSFCYRILCDNINICYNLGYKEVPQIISEDEENKFKLQAQMLSSVKLPKKAWSVYYKPKPKEKFQFEVFHKTLNKCLISEGKITFEKLSEDICNLFRTHNPLVQKYFDKFKYIQVDEFQDTDPTQWEFVKSFLPTASILVCGDIRQNIYAFRGTTSKFIKQMSSDPGWRKIKLEINYRSTIEICEYANNFVRKYNDSVPNVELQSDRHGPNLRHSTLYLFKSNLPTILEDGSTTRAILARTNAEVRELQQALTYFGIPYVSKSKNDSHKIIISAFDEKFYRDYLLSMLTEEEKAKTLRQMYLTPEYDPLTNLESKFYETANKVRDFKASPQYQEWKILYENHELTLDEILQTTKDEVPSTYVGTIHSVKGLEFDSVYVYGVNSKSFQVLKREDYMNLYYVACTRAKTLLTIVAEPDRY